MQFEKIMVVACEELACQKFILEVIPLVVLGGEVAAKRNAPDMGSV